MAEDDVSLENNDDFQFLLKILIRKEWLYSSGLTYIYIYIAGCQVRDTDSPLKE